MFCKKKILTLVFSQLMIQERTAGRFLHLLTETIIPGTQFTKYLTIYRKIISSLL